MSAVPAWLSDEISARGGWVSLYDFMQLALYHDSEGYYMKHVRLGREGDFITAPGMTPVFGACVGDWVVKQWIAMGRPGRFFLLEVGAGEGDMLHGLLASWATGEGDIAACAHAADVRVVEISPRLRDMQEERLAGMDVSWGRWERLPADVPLIVVANEVLDAHPVRQLTWHAKGGWKELGFDEDLARSWRPVEAPAPVLLPADWVPDEGAVIEISDSQRTWLGQVRERLMRSGGAVWLADYGYTVLPPEGGDTVQAVRAHKQVGVTDQPGETDLTTHVDFGRVKQWLGRGEVVPMGPWLMANGMLAHADSLLAMEGGDAVLHRLIHPAGMGVLFKVFTATFDVPEAAK